MTRTLQRGITATLRSSPPGKPLPAAPISTAAGLREGAVGAESPPGDPSHPLSSAPRTAPSAQQACTKNVLNEWNGCVDVRLCVLMRSCL